MYIPEQYTFLSLLEVWPILYRILCLLLAHDKAPSVLVWAALGKMGRVPEKKLGISRGLIFINGLIHSASYKTYFVQCWVSTNRSATVFQGPRASWLFLLQPGRLGDRAGTSLVSPQ